jgi:outer membrane immunogenic protein
MYGTKGSAPRVFLLAGVALAAIAAAEPASAGKDIPAPPPSLWSWSGVYIGAHGGYGWARDPFTDQVFIGKTNTIGGINANGFVAGFQAGANWQSGSWVGGLEIDLSATGFKGSTSGTTGNVDVGGGTTI